MLRQMIKDLNSDRVWIFLEGVGKMWKRESFMQFVVKEWPVALS